MGMSGAANMLVAQAEGGGFGLLQHIYFHTLHIHTHPGEIFPQPKRSMSWILLSNIVLRDDKCVCVLSSQSLSHYHYAHPHAPENDVVQRHTAGSAVLSHPGVLQNLVSCRPLGRILQGVLQITSKGYDTRKVCRSRVAEKHGPS